MRQNLTPVRAWWWYPAKGLLLVLNPIGKVLVGLFHPPKARDKRTYARTVTYSWTDRFGCRHSRTYQDEKPAR
jgi:hypothetical protein